MSDWLGLAFILLILYGSIWGLSILGKPRRLTEKEYARSLRDGTGLAGAGMLELQKILDPPAKKSVEAVQEIKRGKYDKKRNSGDDGE
jgi:hypothetical protein